MGKIMIAYKILIEEPVEKRLLGRRRLRWEGNIKMYP
jgi:hypothetical protein